VEKINVIVACVVCKCKIILGNPEKGLGERYVQEDSKEDSKEEKSAVGYFVV